MSATFIHPDGYQRTIGMSEVDGYVNDCTISMERTNGAQVQFGVTAGNSTYLGKIVANIHSPAHEALEQAPSAPVPLISTKEAARMVGVHEGHLRRLASRLNIGQIVGKQRVFTIADVQRLEQRNTKPGPQSH